MKQDYAISTDRLIRKQLSRKIRELVFIYSLGCGNTLPDQQPEECDECTDEFLRRIREALQESLELPR